MIGVTVGKLWSRYDPKLNQIRNKNIDVSILPHSNRVVIDRESKCHARGQRPEVRVTPSYIYATQTYRQMEYYIVNGSLLFYIECFYSWLRALFCFGCFASRYFNLLRHCSSECCVHQHINRFFDIFSNITSDLSEKCGLNESFGCDVLNLIKTFTVKCFKKL